MNLKMLDIIEMDRMKKNVLYIIATMIFCFGCGKSSTTNPTITWDGNIVAYAPIPVSKASSKKVFVHFMPWFETPSTNSGLWGQHWTMSNQNPNIINNGKRQIASNYYPLIGPYASGDTNVIDYQLLLMKLSGIDGIFIDWPGTLNYSDFRKNLANTNVIVSRLANVGLKYAIVYEDQNLQYASPSTPSGEIAAAQADMSYVQANYFKDAGATYETFNGKPLLLDFGPFSALNSASQWNTIFSAISTQPSFVTYEYQSAKGGTNAVGEFAWVQQNNMTNLNNFYAYGYSGAKFGAAYPGFNSFYAQGGWPGPTWVITPSVAQFEQTLSLALTQSGQYIQVVTWNDYGEGTIIEPTEESQYGYLTSLQQQLGVQSSLSQSDLELVNKLYTARANNLKPSPNQDNLNKLDQAFYDLVSLKMDSAKALLKDF